MAKNQKAPIEVMCVIVKRGDSNKVAQILVDHGVEYQVNCLAEGTARSDVQNLFGFEILDRDMMFGIVDTKKSKDIFSELSKTFNIQIEEQVCMAFTLPLSSATSTMLDLMGITLK